MKLRETQIDVLKILDSKKKKTAADVAFDAASYPGPMARCLNSMVGHGLVRTSGSDPMAYTRTGLGTKAMKKGSF